MSKFEYSQGPLGDVMRTSWDRPESTSQGRPLNVRLRCPLDIISGRPQDVRLGCLRDIRSGRPRDGQIGSLEDDLGTLEEDALGTSWGPIFAGWESIIHRSFLYLVPQSKSQCSPHIPPGWTNSSHFSLAYQQNICTSASSPRVLLTTKQT